MDNKTIRLIYNAFKNCSEYFYKMSEFDECDYLFEQIIKKIKSFFSRKQLFGSESKGKCYVSKGKIKLFFDELNPVSFMELCLLAVLCNCRVEVKVCYENFFATNELILSLVNKTSSYYGFNNLISIEKNKEDITAICNENKVLLLRKGKKYSRLNQKDLLKLEDGESEK